MLQAALVAIASVLISAASVQADESPALVINSNQPGFSDDINDLGVSDVFKAVSSCGTSGPASCHGSASSNSCCYESPGGLLTQVQFWDTNPVTGPADSWTIHGLWPNKCDGTYSENCDKSRAYTNLSAIFDQAGRSDLDDYLSQWMLSNDETPEKFWAHEWETHGTCVSTLDTKCIPSGSPPGTEVVYYFNQIATLFQDLPTYQWLSNQGITPTSGKKFTLEQFTDAIKAEWGYTPAVDCEDGAVYEISYYFNLKGSMIDGEFVPLDAPTPGSCSSSFSYLPKNE
ncbi:ribonuclease T2 [Clavulina sp. PMI_390]|nr:ribonuclease T2 [Clavulina sp. PMI_390]